MDASLRRELGAHLRAAREQVTPVQVGLGGGGRRRTPGLRREEVAALAGVSMAWYTWLEQGRASTTRQVLDAICRVLGMDAAAHRHTLALAGFLPAAPRVGREPVVVGEATRALVDGWATTPAAVLDERFDVLAANRAYRLVWGDPDAAPAVWRNALLLLAAPHVGGGPYRVAAEEPLLRGLYEQFRANTAHWPDDERAAEIVALLTKERPDATHWWECRAVQDFAPITAAVEGVRPNLRLTFSLLRPVAEQGLYVFPHTPADEGSRQALAALIP